MLSVLTILCTSHLLRSVINNIVKILYLSRGFTKVTSIDRYDSVRVVI